MDGTYARESPHKAYWSIVNRILRENGDDMRLRKLDDDLRAAIGNKEEYRKVLEQQGAIRKAAHDAADIEWKALYGKK